MMEPSSQGITNGESDDAQSRELVGESHGGGTADFIGIDSKQSFERLMACPEARLLVGKDSHEKSPAQAFILMNRILVGVILISAFVSSLVIAQIVISQDTGGAPSTVARVVSPTSAPSAAPVTAPAAAPTVTAWKLPRPTATAVRVPATSSASTERSCAAGYRENRSLPFRLCDTGYGIDLIQRGLNTRGFAVVADGYFGQATAAQVRRFQSSRGLSATGDVDATTWLELVGLLDGYDENGDGAVDPSEEFSGD